MADQTTPDVGTTQEDDDDATMTAGAGRPPTEEAGAGEQRQVLDPSVARAQEEAREMGNRNQGDSHLP